MADPQPIAVHATAPDAVKAAWDGVVAAWDEQARHDALLGLVAQAGAFAWAAARYRERAGDPIADRQLERLQRAATATMFATAARKPDGPVPYRSSIIVLVVLVVMLVIGLMYVTLRPHHNDPTLVPPAAPR